MSVVVPMYNEEDNVERTISLLRDFLGSLGIDWEIIAVDDGSDDHTADRLEMLRGGNIRVFHHSRNLGQAAALLTGFSGSDKEFILTIDSDLSFPLKNIPRILARMRKSHADALIGTYYRKGHYMGVSMYRMLLGKSGNLFYRFIFPLKLKQYTCNFRLYRREAVQGLGIDPNARFVGKTAIILEMHRRGMRMESFYITLVPRRRGKSKFRFKDILRHLEFALGIAWLRLSGRYMRVPPHEQKETG